MVTKEKTWRMHRTTSILRYLLATALYRRFGPVWINTWTILEYSHSTDTMPMAELHSTQVVASAFDTQIATIMSSCLILIVWLCEVSGI